MVHGDANLIIQPKRRFLNAADVVKKGLIVEGDAQKDVAQSGPSPCGPGHCP